jgi:hypothetical protein
MQKIKKTLVLLMSGIELFLVACSSPIHTSHVMHTPSEYVYNYYEQPQKKKSLELFNKRGVWVVYSDRSNNPTFVRAGGRIQLLQANFMEPFIVLSRKGDYLRLMKYDPKVILDGKIKDRKNAKFAGWINKADVLLTNQAYVDSNGVNNKYATVFKDGKLLDSAGLYMEKDSFFVFSNANLVSCIGKTPMYEVVYRLKTSDDNKRSLISKTPVLNTDSIKNQVLGWIDNSALTNIGQTLHASISGEEDTLRIHSQWLTNCLPCLPICKNNEDVKMAKAAHHVLTYSPIYEVKNISDSLISLNTSNLLPLVDRKNCFIYNANGHRIYYHRYLTLKNDLKKINIIFAVEYGSRVQTTMPMILDVIQSLGKSFNNPSASVPDSFEYKFGIVLPYEHASRGLVDDYSKILNLGSDYVGGHRSAVAAINPQRNWASLSKAISMLANHKDETNLIVSFGETANGYENIDEETVKQLAGHNCRIIGFQMYSQRTNSDNNFVLQLHDMVTESSNLLMDHEKERIVSSSQVIQNCNFKRVDRNAYLLNYPDSSMVQGGVVFPEKSKYMDMSSVEKYVNLLLYEMKNGNSIMSDNLQNTFYNFGNNNLLFDNVLCNYQKKQDKRLPGSCYVNSFKNDVPVWYSPFLNIIVPKNNKNVDYYLLLSDKELNKVQLFMDGLIKNKMECIHEDAKDSVHGRYNCFNEFEPRSICETGDSLTYKSTRKVRTYLKKYLLKKINEDRCVKIKKSILAKYSLAQALQEITRIPLCRSNMPNIQICQLTDKLYISDKDLDKLLGYFENKRNELNSSIVVLPHFFSNSQKYYWVSEKLMP